MAQLNPALRRTENGHEIWGPAETRAQYAAILSLRWRILLNSFRRKGGRGDLVARMMMYPLAALFTLGPTAGAGILSWYMAVQGTLLGVTGILWGIFVFSQVLNLNLGQPGTTFDPTELIRFPMRLRSYIIVRLFFGLLAPANVVVTTMSVATAIGVSIAIPSLWPYALPAMLIFALTNILFTRMIFAWIDRWMSTRRAREVFTALVFTFSIGFQYVNVKFNPAYNHRHYARRQAQERLDKAVRLYGIAKPYLGALPPGLSGNSLLAAQAGQPLRSLGLTFGCGLYGVAFLAVFSLRMRKEFRGESLSDVANAVPRSRAGLSASHAVGIPAHQEAVATTKHRFLGLSSDIGPLMGRELLLLRRNTGMFYGLVAPLAMVMIFAGKLATHNNTFWIFPAALAYALMGLAPLAYNFFGLEGAGAQFFFLAPVRLRDVFVAKNLMNFLVAAFEGVAVYTIIRYISVPPSGGVVLVGTLWAAGTMLFGNTVGNLRSVSAPKKINLNRTANKQASPLSALMSIGLLLTAAAFGGAVLLMGRFLAMRWFPIAAMLVYAAAGLLVYLTALQSIERYALSRREAMFEELCKAA